jgi:hypothetical protein
MIFLRSVQYLLNAVTNCRIRGNTSDVRTIIGSLDLALDLPWLGEVLARLSNIFRARSCWRTNSAVPARFIIFDTTRFGA